MRVNWFTHGLSRLYKRGFVEATGLIFFPIPCFSWVKKFSVKQTLRWFLANESRGRVETEIYIYLLDHVYQLDPSQLALHWWKPWKHNYKKIHHILSKQSKYKHGWKSFQWITHTAPMCLMRGHKGIFLVIRYKTVWHP